MTAVDFHTRDGIAPALTEFGCGRMNNGPDDGGTKEGGILARLWLGLFVTYTAAAVPLLTWAVASVVL